MEFACQLRHVRRRSLFSQFHEFLIQFGERLMSTLNSFYFQLVPISTEEARSRVSQPRASLRRDDSRGSYLPQRFLFPKNKDKFLLNHFSFLDPTIQSFHNPIITMLPQAAICMSTSPFLHCLRRRSVLGKSLTVFRCLRRQDFPMLPQAAICIVTLCCLRQ